MLVLKMFDFLLSPVVLFNNLQGKDHKQDKYLGHLQEKGNFFKITEPVTTKADFFSSLKSFIVLGGKRLTFALRPAKHSALDRTSFSMASTSSSVSGSLVKACMNKSRTMKLKRPPQQQLS